ncbi:MAG TPA: iron-containing alcohol dehydrogenase [Chloroflexota bacterium]|nr:iron-containing alcohol dehydrogenase [Chloroflexota bacterium]
MREFRIPPLILIGAGSADGVGAVLHARGYRHALVVSDPGVLASPAAAGVLNSLRMAGLAVSVHAGIISEPTVRMVETALVDLRANGADVVVGLGGGSPMDAAKAVAILAGADTSIQDYEGADKVPPRRTPLVCVATSAGTGSEVTRFTIITDEARSRKMLISSWEVMPDIAVADPDLTQSLPARYTVSTGIDALTHAIESFVSGRSQPLSETLALSAIRRISRWLRHAYREPENREARAQMSLAALEAGMSFCNASVALVHGMARPLGAHFGVPHGTANAILLAEVSAFSAFAAAERYQDIAVAWGLPVAERPKEEGATAAIDAIRRLCEDLEVPPLRELDVPRDRFEAAVAQMAKDALASGSPANNPRIATAEEIEQLYRACY